MSGRLVDNILHFARTLRAAGLRIGPGDVLDAVAALEAIGFSGREDLRAALAAVFVKRRQDRDLFDEAFHLFWKDPDLLRRMMALLLPRLSVPGDEEQGSRRLADAFAAGREEARPAPTQPPAAERLEVDIALDWSDRERLGGKDFEKMSADEFAAARRLIAGMTLPLQTVATRRRRPSAHGGRIDMRATLRASLRAGGDLVTLRRSAVIEKPPPLVVLCDISGSMERYARVFLHFMHAVAASPRRFHGFLFGTRLTNVTRPLRDRDPDAALASAARLAQDWSGGTRIGDSLHAFNRYWSRRVLGQGAVVLLMTDGLDRADDTLLAREMERLHKSCRQLIWLNPLLRFDGFQPKAAGIRAMMPHVDAFRPVHSLDSLEDLIKALSAKP